MAAQSGKRYQCSSCGGQIVITRPSTKDISCCSMIMEEFNPKTSAMGNKPSNDHLLELGKRYRCNECGAEALVTKVGKGPLYCHHEMQKQDPKKLASAD
jgi:DNA-directed RNA polymerase subunit RPC12/RpoP